MARNYIRFDRWILIEKDLSDEITIVPTKFPMQISIDSFSETIEYIQQTFYDKNLDEEEKKEIETAKNNGHFYPNIKYNEKIVGFQKLCINEGYVRSLQKYVKFPKDVIFESSIFIDPNHRHKGMGSELLMYSLRMAKEMGFKYVKAHVSPENFTAIKIHSNCGFYEISRFWHFRFFHWAYTTLDIWKATRKNRVSLDPSTDIETFRKKVI